MPQSKWKTKTTRNYYSCNTIFLLVNRIFVFDDVVVEIIRKNRKKEKPVSKHDFSYISLVVFVVVIMLKPLFTLKLTKTTTTKTLPKNKPTYIQTHIM